MTRQLIYGLAFGLLAVLSSTAYGGVVTADGAIINVRDSAVICAGLIFGAPSGIIAGAIGGIFRLAATYLGIVGSYTMLACSVSTALAGVIAAAIKKFMLDNKKPTVACGVGIALVVEVIHMLMIFFTNFSDVATAFGFVKKCTLPMIIGNCIAVGLAVAFVSLLSKEKSESTKGKKQISKTFQTRLLLCIIVAFVVTGVLTAVLQTRLSKNQTRSVIITNLEDVYMDISDASDDSFKPLLDNVKKGYLSGATPYELCEALGVAEINIIDKNGFIKDSNRPEYIGYDMSSHEQSKEFLQLLDGETELYVQEYRPIALDESKYYKYGAIKIPDGFIQVGYDSNHFRADLAVFVKSMARNRHIGKDGFITICDSDFSVVTTSSKHYGEKISALGIKLNPKTMIEGEVFPITLDGTEYLCAYRFIEGYYIIGTMPLSEAMLSRDVSIYVNIFMEMVIFAALFVLIYFLIKVVVIDNIKQINLTLSEITSGNLEVMVDVRSNEEFATLSDDINSTVSTLKHYITEAEARIDKELELAKQIQFSSLPTRLISDDRFSLFANMITAKEVGGDFYDLLPQTTRM